MGLIVSEFIKLEIDFGTCLGSDKCGKCVEVCPVNIFVPHEDHPSVAETNEDECTLCNLCLEACEVEAIIIHKLYEE